jgi:hypothetical protein
MTEALSQQITSSECVSAPEKTATQSVEVASNVEYRGERDDSIRAHTRFLLFSILVGCGLLEYGFDQGIIGSFQAMVGFLKVYGYEDPALPSGWVSFARDSALRCDLMHYRTSHQFRNKSSVHSCF